MDTDHFGLWIETRAQPKQFNDDELNQDSQIFQFIIDMFGGFKNMFLFILNDPTKFTSKQLYQLRSAILELQKNLIMILLLIKIKNV